MRSLRWLVLSCLLAGGCAGGEITGPQSKLLAKKAPDAKPNNEFNAEQPNIDINRNPLAIYPLVTDRNIVDLYRQNLTQTFTAEGSVQLQYLYLPIACAQDVLLRLQITQGGPDGVVLFDRNIDPLRRVADGEFVAFQIYGGLDLVDGSTYGIVLSSVPGPSATESTCSIIPGPDGDSYAGGQGFYNNPGFPANYWVPLPDGATTSSEDLPFRTVVRR